MLSFHGHFTYASDCVLLALGLIVWSCFYFIVFERSLLCEVLGLTHHTMDWKWCFTRLESLMPWSFSKGPNLCSEYTTLFVLFSSILVYVLVCFPRSASEVNPEKREFLRGNAGLVGEILGPFILHWKFKQLTGRIINRHYWLGFRPGYALISSPRRTSGCQFMMLLGFSLWGWPAFCSEPFDPNLWFVFWRQAHMPLDFRVLLIVCWAVHGKCFMTRMLANFSVLSSGCGDTDLKLLE